MKYATALGIIMVLIITPGRAAESPVDLQSPVNRPIFGCLFETSLGTKKLDECYGLISNRCLDEVAEAGGNLGTRTIRGCAARELASWFDAWVDALEEATWSTLSVDLATGAWTDDLAPTLARFARVQARTEGQGRQHPDHRHPGMRAAGLWTLPGQGDDTQQAQADASFT
jgi:hypothetical protein